MLISCFMHYLQLFNATLNQNNVKFSTINNASPYSNVGIIWPTMAGQSKGNHLTTSEEFILKGTSQEIKWTASGRQNYQSGFPQLIVSSKKIFD